MKNAALAALTALALAGCDPETKGRPPPEPSPTRKAAEITILYTSDEHGWLLPFSEGGKSWGGAAEVLQHWIANEEHCPGPVPPGEGDLPKPEICSNPKTIAISGGDNYTGPAISSFYSGQPMADQLRRMGYSMSAFGNHEFDFGRDELFRLSERAKIPYVAANLRVTDPMLKDQVKIAPFLVFERRGVRVGVVGLASDQTLEQAMASRFAGITFDPEEQALGPAIEAAWKATPAPDVLILVAHDCPDRLKPILERHPDWKLSIVLAGHCHKVIEEHAKDLTILSPGWRLQHYIRVRLAIDPSRPERDRATQVLPQVVDMARSENEPPRPVDPPMEHARTAWKRKLDEALGEEIGFTVTGFDKTSPEITRWIAGAFRAELKTEVGLVNEGGIRQALPKGRITKATVWSILPFDNKMVVLGVRGKDLAFDMTNDEARAVGFDAKKLVDDHVYSVATIDFLYFGGAKFKLKEQDASPKEIGTDWREPVIEWTKRLKTTAADPLEKHLP